MGAHQSLRLVAAAGPALRPHRANRSPSWRGPSSDVHGLPLLPPAALGPWYGCWPPGCPLRLATSSQTLTSASPHLAPMGPHAWMRSTATAAAARQAGQAYGAKMVGGGTARR